MEWNLDDDKVRKIACVRGIDRANLFLDDEDVFCGDGDSFDILYIGNEDVLINLHHRENTIAARATLTGSDACFISMVI